MIFLDDIDRSEQLIWAFHVWLESFDAVDDGERLLDSLSGCQEQLPAHLCRDFGLPTGSSYAAAAELFLSLWATDSIQTLVLDRKIGGWPLGWRGASGYEVLRVATIKISRIE
ncbi:MAG: hypothetical protein P8N76_22585 [Pirellulaceae bacterium]|nr:hypothetical protein [Pirellulaceae bacterium]